MKRIHQALVLAAALALPLASHAESTATRVQIRADLISAEQAGTYPMSDAHYPDAAVGRPVVRQSQGDAYGSSTHGSFASGFSKLGTHIKGTHDVSFDDVYRGQ
ncbi:DUF4148 domain-containing protein [Paraburkholderia saeva]|uniref:DUF4148 domain-containing protein n=1 Tax=Paraburkholderia saeva TaxID=2777537 RepID=UPI001D86C526|nr:DUF4148 domain-containing protein [Paraburkholderia saeva]CAG4902235.1 hypothetical protein R70241_02943 [Paraburkholderia saeva]